VFEPAYDGSFLLSPGPQGHVPAPTQALSTDHKIELSQAPPLAAPLPSYNFFPPLDSQTQPQTWKADCTVSQAPAPLAQRPMLVTSIEPTQHTAHSSQLPSPARLSAVSRTSRTSIHPTNLPKDIPPRFFIGFRSFLSEFPTIFYLKGGSAGAPSRPWNILGPTEIEKGYIATLMMSSGLVGMASQGLGSSISHDGGSGWVGFGAEEQGAEFARAVEVM
jgi:hypothetical protein